jgi:ATP-dependent Lon protease
MNTNKIYNLLEEKPSSTSQENKLHQDNLYYYLDITCVQIDWDNIDNTIYKYQFEDIDFSKLSFSDVIKKIDTSLYFFFHEKLHGTIDFSHTKIARISKVLAHIFDNNIFEQTEEMENWCHSIILKILQCALYEYNAQSFHDYYSSTSPLIQTLLKKISVEKLNSYNQETQTSILKLLLKDNECVAYLDIFLQSGLIVGDIEGLNPYFFVLKNSNSYNLIAERLYNIGVQLPPNCGNYLIQSILEEKILAEQNFLLNLNPFDFIIDKELNHCIWHKIFQNQNLSVEKIMKIIKLIPDAYYKPCLTKCGQSILGIARLYMGSNKKLISKILDERQYRNIFIKLAHDPHDLNLFMHHLVLEFESKQLEYIFAHNYSAFVAASLISNKKDSHNSSIELVQLVSNYCQLVQKLLMNKKSELISLGQEYNLPLIDKNLNDFNRKVFNPLLTEQSIVEIINQLTPSRFELLCLQIVSNFFDSSISLYCFNEFKRNSTEIPEKEYELLIELENANNNIKKHQERLSDRIKEHIKKGSINLSTDSEDNNSISIPLYQEQDWKKFKSEYADTNNDSINKMINNFSKKVSPVKKIATSSYLLSKINSLYETFPHFQEVIKHIENIMILQNKGDKTFYLPPLLLGGGPGVGKTFFAHSLSQLVDTHFEMLNMESMTANWILTGSASQWKDATPGKIYSVLTNKDNPTINPIFLLDELEKTKDTKYGVIDSLLPLLERYTAKRFKDECLPLPIDASHIIWIATANDIEKLSAPIKSRFDIFTIPSPNKTQKMALIKGIYSATMKNNSWGSYFEPQLPAETIEVFTTIMSTGAARDLRKSITLACSKAIVENSNVILPHHIERYEQEEVMPWNILK